MSRSVRDFIVTTCCLFLPGRQAVAGDPVQLASQGRATYAVIVSASASPQSRTVAAELADYLGKISHTHFDVRVGDGTAGIAVGTRADFPMLKEQSAYLVSSTTAEAYLLRSHADGLYVLGVGDQGVEHAVWDLLSRLGYRQYFPGPIWEIIPDRPELSVEIDVQLRPDYDTRLIWHGFGTWGFAKPAFSDWRRKNRLGSEAQIKFGHAYQGIYDRNSEEFSKHPEYLCPRVGRTGVKFRISNPGLRDLVVADAIRQVVASPTVASISMEPSDGGGWCDESQPELKKISDRVLWLANEVAMAVGKHNPDILVTMNAYNEHSPPPTFTAHPQVLVMVATAFRRGGYSQEQLIDGWAAKVRRLGIREYYSVNPWDHDLPGRARAGNLGYIKTSIPAFHAKGARALSAESSDNWGPNGLGYFLSARLLWDVDEAANADTLVGEFLANAFGPASEPMRDYYQAIDGAGQIRDVRMQLAKMYRALHEARRNANTPVIHARLDHLVLYTRYVELYQQYVVARGAKRQSAVMDLLQFAWRIRKTTMVHTRALPTVIRKHDKRVQLPPGNWETGTAWATWRSAETFSREQLTSIVKAGMERFRIN